MSKLTRKIRRAQRVLDHNEHNLVTLVVITLQDSAHALKQAGLATSADRFERAKKLIEELRELHS